MKKKNISVLVIVVLVIGSIIGLYFYKNQSSAIRQCPDEWIENRMPSIEGDNSQKQYFVFESERKEIRNYDVDWIKSNCSVKVQYVY